jgi:hypothetical protein
MRVLSAGGYDDDVWLVYNAARFFTGLLQKRAICGKDKVCVFF